MKLKNKLCSVELTIDEEYTVQSSDNRHYDLELNPEGFKHSDLYKTLSIHIDLFNREINIALVGDIYYKDSDCAILEENILTILQNDAISRIDVNTGTLIQHKRLENFGCNFGIYKVMDGYLIYGEVYITMLDRNLNKKWAFGGRDIFVSQSNKNSFEIGEHSIKLYDWEDNFYEVDFDGKLIGEILFVKSCEKDRFECGISRNRFITLLLPRERLNHIQEKLFRSSRWRLQIG